MYRRIALLILTIGLLQILVSAQENTPTAVGTPSGQSMRVQGPINLLDNVHAAAAPFTSVIANPILAGETLPILVNGRVIEVPPGWSYTGVPGLAGLPPFIARYDGPGLRFGWDYVSGSAGFAQDGIQLFGNQRYVVRVQYTTDLQYTLESVPYTPAHLRVRGRLYTAGGGFTELPGQAFRGTQESHTIEWVIESTRNPYPFVRLEILMDMQWPIFIGKTYLEQIDILTAPADYRPAFVIDFE